ncbi:MAG TPA: DUF4416 family protein [Thermoguttaceae bacterium]|nr:DUF4416 family protein [Thermoguttaceae bacterium]
MGEPTPHSPALLLIAAFSRHDAALDWARARAVEAFGPIDLQSPVFEFSQTDYYEPTMGPGLRKVFFTFARPFDPADMADVKLQTNAWEQEYAEKAGHGEPRPLNLDPGYLTLAKLVLASTKDHAHRIYLQRGIYAEVTLYYRDRQWQSREWTFADYRREDYQQFFTQCRQRVRDLPR